MIYVDTSALGRAYFSDEPDHAALRALLLGGLETVATSSLTRVELASAAHRAARAGRIRDGRAMLDRFDADCGADGPIMRLRLRPTGCWRLPWILWQRTRSGYSTPSTSRSRSPMRLRWPTRNR